MSNTANQKINKIDKGGVQEYQLSWYQERMWMLNKKRPDDLSYNIPVVFLLEGDLNLEVLNKSLTEILRRHETLRARFITNSRGEPVQIITPEQPFILPVIPAEESEIPRHIAENAAHVFDLSKGPIFIGRLLVIGPQRHLLLLNVHHIAADGWSIESILFSELQECYEAFFNGTQPALKPLPVQYTDFAKWQRGLDTSKDLEFWKKHLADYESALELPSDFLRTPKSGSTSERFEYHYKEEFSQALDKFAKAHGCTIFMALLASFALTVKRYTGKEDLCIGTTTSGRILPEIEGLIGFFINILPLRFYIDENMTVEEFMVMVRKTALDGYEHQVIPFEHLVYSSTVENGSSLVPLVIRHQNFPRANLEKELSGGLKFCSYPGYEGYRTATGHGAFARAEVEMSFTGNANKLDVEIMYASDLYREETIERLVRHHERILSEMMSNSKKRLSEVNMLTEKDYNRLFVEYNKTDSTVENPLDFTARWDQQASKTPDSIACFDSYGSWKYGEIDAAANLLAAKISRLGIGKGDVVAICMERSAALLAAFIAVWKTGAAYVPLDPSYPESYLKIILADSAPKLVLCSREQQAKLELKDDACFIRDSKLLNVTGEVPKFESSINPEDIAYIMYTSGSTGTPKGVKVPHLQLINWLSGLEKNWPFEADEVIAQKTTIAFAVSVKEIFAGLLNGCPLAFIDTDTVKDTALFVAALKKSNSSRLNIVPSHLQTVLTYLKKEKIELPSLRLCITAGEPLTSEQVSMFKEVLPHVRLLNNYGCTELNDITYYDATDFDGSKDFVPIGRPIQNTKIYVLDRMGRPVPEGVPGELHVAGASMAHGYNNLPEMTKERFLPNPFSNDPESVLFNTGDVVRYLSDGNIEYLGRWDFQVKIRGFRVDVRHVEKILGEYEGMGVRAVVGEGGQLIAYYVEQPGKYLDVGKIRLFLEERLPSYMVPTAFVALQEMPKLPNGKLNRRALKMSLGKLQQSDKYEVPSTHSERKLAEIWAEVLEIPEERIGRRAHFFEMGGHSLSATRLVSKIKECFKREIPLSYVFEHPHLYEIAAYIDRIGEQCISRKSILDCMDEQWSDESETIRRDKIGEQFREGETVSCNEKNPKSFGNGQISINGLCMDSNRGRQVRVPGLLENKVVLITGASRGIGRATARLLASHGASVAINYFKSDQHAMSIKEIIEEDGGIADVFQADITDAEQVNKLVEQVHRRFGRIDVLVANAAMSFKITPFVSSEWADFELKLVNELKSIFLLCKAVTPEMIERKSGSIIAVSSTMSKNAQNGYSAHSASKAALDAFVKAVAAELGPDGVRMNIVAPGLVLTDSSASMANEIKEASAKHSPLRRNGLPRDIAGAILFLASDLSQFMTGTYLPVDGGHTML
jgi:amino acid adenylation domain-containing protein